MKSITCSGMEKEVVAQHFKELLGMTSTGNLLSIFDARTQVLIATMVTHSLPHSQFMQQKACCSYLMNLIQTEMAW